LEAGTCQPTKSREGPEGGEILDAPLWPTRESVVTGLPTKRGPKRLFGRENGLSEMATNILMLNFTRKVLSLIDAGAHYPHFFVGISLLTYT
jgi:hypothetical protein